MSQTLFKALSPLQPVSRLLRKTWAFQGEVSLVRPGIMCPHVYLPVHAVNCVSSTEA